MITKIRMIDANTAQIKYGKAAQNEFCLKLNKKEEHSRCQNCIKKITKHSWVRYQQPQRNK